MKLSTNNTSMNDPMLLANAILIGGPTGTGKTALAIKLANEYDGDIINADSRQVYKAMTIGTGKDVGKRKFHLVDTLLTKEGKIDIGFYSLHKTKIWLYDMVEPNFPMSISHWYSALLAVLAILTKTDRLPIITGGTGFYLNSVIHPPETLHIPVNSQLRAQIESLEVNALQIKLLKLSPSKYHHMNLSDQKNKRRLIRAIEVALESSPKPQFPRLNITKSVYLCLTSTTDHILRRIKKRVRLRIKQGFLSEIQSLYTKYPEFASYKSSNTLGYKEYLELTKANISLDEFISLWVLHELQYAKRQLTWFRKYPDIAWFDIDDQNCYASVTQHIMRQGIYANSPSSS